VAINTSFGFHKRGERDRPGGAHKRNFNKNPTGKLPLNPNYRHVHSRSKSRGGHRSM
jgi:hypothetical protein